MHHTSLLTRAARGLAVLTVLAFAVSGCGAGAGAGAGTPTSTSASHTATGEQVPESAQPAERGPAPEGSDPEDAETRASSASLSGLTIAVDPGHNGDNGANPATIRESVPDGRGGTKDCNTVGTESTDGYPEHRFAWEAAEVLVDALEEADASVVLSRADDNGVGPCVDERGTFADDADALVSLHANGTEDHSARGFHVIAAPAGGRADEQVADVSEALGTALAASLEDAGLTRSPAYDDLVVRDDLATLNNASVPAIMVEAGEMRNAEDARMLQSEKGQQRIARAIVDALAVTLVR
ncbi:N-acetylmuramoyl-L-alanine amidase [Brevibacterium jeotgali]|uniref:N-acetylmuramoyl-L-alanine amidase n=1 Tax=Brevibacterium jeotgali TaxID=1262550 RepID=A0A2H1L6R1_9MICO|nr:N-acetylmuramoyl-L-alanine amidase [Brevibacterium jeotgali]TWC02671.1 N-acetylmuramoyl-L-alanine amidase [Brevibacterium jeotgali]SMY12581.1 N-acetylmuramoyl-L-alanine amidase [Brevibacterium jeotgali]